MWTDFLEHCGYCYEKGHKCAKCYYLSRNPPRFWYAKLDIRCYKDRPKPKPRETKNDKDTARKPAETPNVASLAFSNQFSLPNIGGASIDIEAFAEYAEKSSNNDITPKSNALAVALSATTPESLIGKYVADTGAGNSIARDFANWVELYRHGRNEEAYTYECSNVRAAKATGYGTNPHTFRQR